MSILYRSEHTNCLNYDHNERAQISIQKIARGEMLEVSITDSEIVFIIEGRLKCVLRDHSEYEGVKGQVVFLPAGGKYRLRAMADSVVTVFRFHEYVKLCESYGLEQLFAEQQGGTDHLSGEHRLNMLDINSRLWNFLDGVRDAITDGIKCRYYFGLKVKELLLLMRAYYTKEELHFFFSLILSSDTVFSEYVRQNWQEMGSVTQLARSLHITHKQFYTRFNAIFGMTPIEWINRAKARIIHNEIISTHKQFKRIAAEHKFASDTQFSRFCKANLGSTPSELREKNTQAHTQSVENVASDKKNVDRE